MVNKKIVCLGGGIGTVNLIKGLNKFGFDIIVVASMADDGGSAGRIRRLFSMPPPGDLVSCITALSEGDDVLKKLLTYRFAGERYGADGLLGGHKFGNLMMVALTGVTGDFNKALEEMQRIFKTRGKIFPATLDPVTIWAQTSVGERVDREENIDLGRFTGRIESLHLKPENPKVSKEVVDALESADTIIAGPGDLYSTTLPTLLVPKIKDAIRKSKAKKIFIVNVANKLFETPNYKVEDYMVALKSHCGANLFSYVFMNNNQSKKIDDKYKRQYELVPLDYKKDSDYTVIVKDLINAEFPLYHDSTKLAKAIIENISR